MHIPLIDRIICRAIRLEQDQSDPSFAHFARALRFSARPLPPVKTWPPSPLLGVLKRFCMSISIAVRRFSLRLQKDRLLQRKPALVQKALNRI
jgi:hypothetical protein